MKALPNIPVALFFVQKNLLCYGNLLYIHLTEQYITYNSISMTVEQFLIYFQHEKRYSSHTIQSYKTDLLQFGDFMLKTFELPLTEVKYIHVRDFMVILMDDKISANSVGRKLSTLRSFYKFLLRENAIVANPMALVKAPKVPKKLPVFVDEAKLDLLLDSTEFFDDSFPSVRDRLIVETLFGTGMRLAELLSLKETDINFYDSTHPGNRQKEQGKGYSDQQNTRTTAKGIYCA